MRIDKLLANMGVGSRKEVKEYIKMGFVKVNGNTVLKATDKVDEDKDEISFRDDLIEYKKYTYIMLNKPQGVISASRGYNHRTVVDLVGDEYKNRGLFPAGRLDKDTEGLILLTNDGLLAHNLLSPKKEVVKKYFARVDKKFENKDVQKFKTGIYLNPERYLTKPAILEIISDYECFVYIQEGKYHQVKRMLADCGKDVTYLKRVSIGPLILDESLELGEFRNLTEEELTTLKEVTEWEQFTGGITVMDYKDLTDKKREAETKQRDAGNSEKPSSDLYSNIKYREEDTGVEVPTDEAVEEAMEWVEENRK